MDEEASEISAISDDERFEEEELSPHNGEKEWTQEEDSVDGSMSDKQSAVYDAAIILPR